MSTSIRRPALGTASRLRPVAADDSGSGVDANAPATSVWTCTWTTGPDSGGQVVVADRALIGRAPGAEVRCDDPAIEPHHALLEVGPAGIRLVQLTGRMPLVVRGRPVDTGVLLTDGAVIELGHSTLQLHLGTTMQHPPAHVRDGALVRGPRSIPLWAPSPLTPPAADEASRTLPGGLVPALLAIAGSGILALLMRQPMFLLFGALGGVIALSSWVAQRVGLARGRRRSKRRQQTSLDEFRVADAALRRAFVEHLGVATMTTVAALQAIRGRDHRLWARRAAHPDAFTVALGSGELLWLPPLSERPATGARAIVEPLTATSLRDQPITVDLGPGRRIAVRGDAGDADGIVRALIVQLVAACGPADLRLVVVTAELARWRFIVDLPHAVAPDGSTCVVTPDDLPSLLAAIDQPGMPHVVIVTDVPELLASRTNPLRRAVTAERGPALIALVPTGTGVPHVCGSVLSIAPAPATSSARPARWVADAAANALPISVRVAALGSRAATHAAEHLRLLSDPDDPFGEAAGLPSTVSLLDLLAGGEGSSLTPAAIAARWLAGSSDPHPCTPIGVAAEGLVDIDLVRDGPHALFAGTTGSGKSELLRSLVAGMAVGASPDHLTFVLVDYKGGATFDACAALPHVVGIVTDLDEHLADRALRSLDAELRRRETLLRDHGAGDLSMLREMAPHVVLPRLVVVIDEFAALVAEQPNFLRALVGVAQRGRSLGVHLLLATQRPNGVISDDIRANTNIRLALRLQDSSDALDVVGDAAPTAIPRRAPGRAVLRLGPEEHVTFQTARCTGTTPSELDAIVRAVRDATTIVGVATPVGPWQPPLPEDLDHVDVAPDVAAGSGTTTVTGTGSGPAIGLVDDPDHQQLRPLTWRADAGHLLVAGVPGSGVTATLITLARHTLDTDPTAHVYVIDGKGDDAFSTLTGHPRCAGVVRLHEHERMMRLLRRLATVVVRRAAAGGRGDDRLLLLIVDGFTDLRTRLAGRDTVGDLEALDQVIAAGAGVGVSAVLAVEQAGAMPGAVLARCPQRWILHLADHHDALAWGFASSDVPGPIAGRAAIGDGLHAQLVRPGAPARLHLAAPSRRGGDGNGLDGSDHAEPLQILPTTFTADRLDGGWLAAGSTWLPLGLSFAEAEQVTVEVPDGEHLLILGPARSGRSTALARVVAAWHAVHPQGWSAVLMPRRGGAAALVRTHRDLASMLGDVPASGPVLLAVDDGDIVDDPGGALAALVAARRPHLLVVATGRPEVLRQSYGHWTTVVRRSRLGLVLSACGDIDGDLLGASIPRRRPIGARPGLAWLCDNGEVDLVQIAVDPGIEPGNDAGVGAAAAEPRAPAATRSSTGGVEGHPLERPSTTPPRARSTVA